MEKVNKVFIYMALLALFVYPLSIYGSIIIAVTALVLSIVLVKNKEQTGKVLQPVLMTVAIVVARSIFALILSIIQRFASIAENYEVVNNVNKALSCIDAIFLIVLIIFIVVATVFIVINKDIPIAEYFSNKILGIHTEKQSYKKEVEPTVAVKTESKQQNSSVKKTKKGTIIIDATKKNDEE